MIRDKITTSLLKSPFHRLIDHDTMLLTYTGQVSRQPYTMPVHYFAITEQRLLAFVERERQWWHNLADGLDITLNIRQESFIGKPIVIDDVAWVAELLQNCLLARPECSTTYGIGLDAYHLPDMPTLFASGARWVTIYIKLYTVLNVDEMMHKSHTTRE